MPMLPEQCLHDAHAANILRAFAVVCPPEGVQGRHRPFRGRRGRDQLAHLEESLFRRAAYALDHFGRVRLDVLAQKLHDAARVLHRFVNYRIAVGADFIVPGGAVVVAFFLVIAGEQAFGEIEALLHHKPGVGVCLDVLVLELVVIQQIFAHAIQERDVASRPDRAIQIGAKRVIADNIAIEDKGKESHSHLSAAFSKPRLRDAKRRERPGPFRNC
jgi:hypothetical protein